MADNRGVADAVCTWVVLTFGDERQYGGNTGYEDSTSEYYRYDDDVSNYKQIKRGDIAIVCDKTTVVGAARIERIEKDESEKTFQRCPLCRTTSIKARKNKSPKWRCHRKTCRHAFAEPLVETAECKRFTAFYQKPFLRCPRRVDRALLRSGCPRLNDQSAMQFFDRALIAEELAAKAPELNFILLGLSEPSPKGAGGTAGAGHYGGPLPAQPSFGTAYRRANEELAIQLDPFPIDPEIAERGVRGHATTQNLLEEALANAGIVALSPRPTEPNFDIGWEANGLRFVAEVKSLTAANEEKQLRLGLGQVLRYAQQLGGDSRVIPVLVPEREPSDPDWTALCRSLGVLLAWPQRFAEVTSNSVSLS